MTLGKRGVITDMGPVYRLLAAGWSIAGIANEYDMAESSLRTTMQRHRRRIGARTTIQAMAMMIERGAVKLGQEANGQ